jgi:hypothetical protein
MRMGTIRATNATAAMPIGRLALPRFQVWHAADTGMDEHYHNGEEKNLIILGDKVRMVD